MAAFLRFIFFCVFFAAGSAAIAVSILSEELYVYYNNRGRLAHLEYTNRKIEQLIPKVGEQIEQIEKDPNILNKLRPLITGKQPFADDTAFPRGEDSRIESIVDLAVERAIPDPEPQVEVPAWITRTMQQRVRYSLFLAGAGLILLDFIFFGAAEKKN